MPEETYSHAEAYMHMIYAAKDDPSVWVTVWNSRDGVTPFGMRHPRLDVDLLHQNWALDVFDRYHVPEVGAYVWVDLSPEKALQIAEERVEHWWDHPEYPMSQVYATKEAAKQIVFDSFMYIDLPNGQRVEKGEPDLVQVTEPLHDEFARRAREAGHG